MLHVYSADQGKVRRAGEGEPLPAAPVWLDLHKPTVDEEKRVEAALGVHIPTREEMGEIEVSSRLYEDEGILFMTALVMSGADTTHPAAGPVTFILANGCLVTVRYSEPRPFSTFGAWIQRSGKAFNRGDLAACGLLDAIIDRIADILERIAGEVDGISADVFRPRAGRSPQSRQLEEVLTRIGQQGDLASKARESLVTIGRLTGFLARGLEMRKAGVDLKARIDTLMRDVHSLTDHASFVANKINFLLDATLGLINIEQNAIIKIFSVAAVVLMPPTLIASIYGMNFHHMPELALRLGYPIALVLMIVSAIVPYWFFKRRGWL